MPVPSKNSSPQLEAARCGLRVLCDIFKITPEAVSSEHARRYRAGRESCGPNDELTLTEDLARDIRTGAWPIEPMHAEGDAEAAYEHGDADDARLALTLCNLGSITLFAHIPPGLASST